MSEQNKNGGAAFGATAESRAITHAADCWSWGPAHYECAVREIKAKRAEVAAWRELSDRMEAVLDQLQAEIERLRAEVSELRAARIAYASEFPEAKDGGPDTGNIHTNIRSLKARAERLAEALEDLISWIPSADTYRRLGFDPETPMRAWKKARAALGKENSND